MELIILKDINDKDWDKLIDEFETK